MEICGHTADTIISVVEESVKQMAKTLESQGIRHRKSGYLTIRDGICSQGHILLLVQIGIVPFDGYERYLFNSQEKGSRLLNHPEHRSSWQSRNEQENRFAGAIVVPCDPRLIMSFSGLPELADEAVMLDSARVLGWISPEDAVEIARISDNHYYL